MSHDAQKTTFLLFQLRVANKRIKPVSRQEHAVRVNSLSQKSSEISYPTVIGTMNAVRHSCHKELQLAEGTIPECEGYIYEPDDHFSAFITYAFITTLLETHEA